MTALLALAFGAGMLAPVNPCGFAVLPAFLAYATGAHHSPVDTHASVPARLAGGLHAGLALTAGFAGTFTLIGLLLAFGLRSLIGVIPWFAAVVGAVLAVLGMMMLAGARLPLRLPSTPAGTLSRGPLKMVRLAWATPWPRHRAPWRSCWPWSPRPWLPATSAAS